MQWVRWRKQKFGYFSQKTVIIFLLRHIITIPKSLMRWEANFINYMKIGEL